MRYRAIILSMNKGFCASMRHHVASNNVGLLDIKSPARRFLSDPAAAGNQLQNAGGFTILIQIQRPNRFEAGCDVAFNKTTIAHLASVGPLERIASYSPGRGDTQRDPSVLFGASRCELAAAELQLAWSR